MGAVLVAAAPAWPAAGEAAPAGAASRGAAGFRAEVVQTGSQVLAGPPPGGVDGPATLRARFPRPTTAGDLLVAAVTDGVLTSGMRQPGWHPAGWRRAASVIGGNTADGGRGGYATGGLQAAIFYRTDNPGGITSVPIGKVPAGTVADATVALVELSGLPHRLTVSAAGSSTSGPSPATDGIRRTVATRAAPSRLPALVLALFVNGATSPAGERFARPARWRVLGQNGGLHRRDQPLLLDGTVWYARRRPSQTVGFEGVSPSDNCAVMVALSP